MLNKDIVKVDNNKLDIIIKIIKFNLFLFFFFKIYSPITLYQKKLFISSINMDTFDKVDKVDMVDKLGMV